MLMTTREWDGSQEGTVMDGSGEGKEREATVGAVGAAAVEAEAREGGSISDTMLSLREVV